AARQFSRPCYFFSGCAAADGAGSVNGKKLHAGLVFRKFNAVMATELGEGAGAPGSAFNGRTLRNAAQAAVGPGPNSRFGAWVLRTSSQRVPVSRSAASKRKVSSTAV